jgi:hypothetical protein
MYTSEVTIMVQQLMLNNRNEMMKAVRRNIIKDMQQLSMIDVDMAVALPDHWNMVQHTVFANDELIARRELGKLFVRINRKRTRKS